MDPYPFVKLAQSGLPPRVRGLLEGAYQAAQPIIEAALTRALDDLDRDLLAHAERGAKAVGQNPSLAGLREFRLRRAEFLQTCRAAVQRSMLALVDLSLVDNSLKPGNGRLVMASGAADATSRDEDLTLSQIAARAEIRAAAELQALAWRFGVIAGSPPLDLDDLALGPNQLCTAIRIAARCFEVIPAHRLALYRRIDKMLFAEPRGLYEAINRYLVDHRVFAHLRLPPTPDEAVAAEASASAPPVASAPQAPRQAHPLDQGQAVQSIAAMPMQPPAAATGSKPVSDLTPTAADPAMLPESLRPLPPHRPATTEAAADVSFEAGFFQFLRESLVPERQFESASGGGDIRDSLVDWRELDRALSVLQAQPPTQVIIGGKWSDRDMGHIRQDLMSQLRGSSGERARLRREDAQTIDLIGLLFAQLLASIRAGSISHGLISRLQIPVLRAALRDAGFFTSRAHPARRFVDAVVDCVADWVDDEGVDRPLVDRLHAVVDRLHREFREDVGSFAQSLEDLEKHLVGLRRKAEVAERRLVEAARGREKLDLARAAAHEAVQEQLRGAAAPAAIATLLENAWVDALALSLLRQGVDHPKTHERIALVEQMLAVYDRAFARDPRRAALERLRPALEDGLIAVGFHDAAITMVWNDLRELIDAPQEQQHNAASRAIVDLIRQKPRFGGDTSGTAGAGDEPTLPLVVDPAGLDASERDMVEYIGQLPFGTWFEFSADRSSNRCRRRLSWFSPVTGRCLFVNSRGVKCEDRSVAQLARELLCGAAQVVSKDDDPPINRAWRAIRAGLHEARVKAAPLSSQF